MITSGNDSNECRAIDPQIGLQERSGEIKAREPSVFRRFRNAMEVVCCDWVRTKSCQGEKVAQLVESHLMQVGNGANSSCAFAVKILNQRGFLKASTIRAYGSYLEDSFPSFRMNPSYLYSGASFDQIPTASDLREMGIRLYAIPFAIVGNIDHAVVLLADLEAGRLEYYDAKGLTLRDRHHCELRDPSYGDPLELAVRVSTKLWPLGAPPSGVYENTKKQQGDLHSCGVYVCDYLSRRCEGESAFEISHNPRSFREINGPIRERMIAEIAPDLAPLIEAGSLPKKAEAFKSEAEEKEPL